MLIDGAPIRDKARRDYQKVLRDVDKTREEIERFEKQDRPGFTRWLNTEFGALLTEIREITQKLESQTALLYEIESEALLTGCSFTRAYEQVMWRREHPEPEPPDIPDWDKPGGESSSNGAGNGAFDDEFERFFSEVKDEFDRMFGGCDQDEAPRRKRGEAVRDVPARLKELYRALARRLHPDVQEQMTWQKKEWWYQVQAAYDSGDVERLQVILALCEIEEQGITAKTSVSLLVRITREFKNSLRALKKQLNQYRRDPAWEFSASTDRSAVFRRMQESLRADLIGVKRQLAAVESTLQSWARTARGPVRRPRRPRRSSQPEFFF